MSNDDKALRREATKKERDSGWPDFSKNKGPGVGGLIAK